MMSFELDFELVLERFESPWHKMAVKIVDMENFVVALNVDKYSVVEIVELLDYFSKKFYLADFFL